MIEPVTPVTFSDLLARLTAAWTAPLPGTSAHIRMAPHLRGEWPAGVDPAEPRRAAGLLLVYPVDDRPHIVLTVRSPRVRHGGQVSLPGGVIEPGESVDAAAVRETREEVALDAPDLRVLGHLTPLDIPVSGFRLHPVVASTVTRPRFAPADAEVARILEVPVATLLDASCLGTQPMVRGALSLDVPVFRIDDVAIWGATAMVLAEFLTLLGWPPKCAQRSRFRAVRARIR